MNYGKAVEEVWEWRERLSEQLEGLSEEEQIRFIHENAKKACEKYGIKYKVKKEEISRA